MGSIFFLRTKALQTLRNQMQRHGEKIHGIAAACQPRNRGGTVRENARNKGRRPHVQGGRRRARGRFTQSLVHCLIREQCPVRSKTPWESEADLPWHTFASQFRREETRMKRVYAVAMAVALMLAGAAAA